MEKGKKISRRILLAFLLIASTVAIAFATSYAVIQWQVNMTVVANPKVCFVDWSTGTTKANTFTYSVNIFPSIKTIDTNITYGIWNWDSSAHNIYFKLSSENTNSTDVSWFYYKVYDGATLFSKNETDFGSPDTAYSIAYSALATTKYTIEVQVKAGASAVAGHTPAITFEMRVDAP